MIKLIKIIFILSFIVAIITSVFRFVAFDFSWYQKEFSLQKVYDVYSQERVKNQTINLLSYFKNQKPLETGYYTSREVAHLADVKTIIQFLLLLNIISLAALIISAAGLIYTAGPAAFSKTLFIACIFLLGIAVVLSAGLIFNFDWLFLGFHRLVFNNNFWLLDPSIESLVVIFPSQFFADIAVRLFKIAFIVNIAILALASLMYKKSKPKA